MKRESLRLRPTGFWLLFGPILGCMWLAAVNYSNNLIYAILYLIGALSFVSIFHAWRNLVALEIEHVRIHSAFAGEEARVEIYLRNSSSHPIYGLLFARHGEEIGSSRRLVPLPVRGQGGVRIEGGDARTVEVLFPARRRGMYRFEALWVRTSYPFGLFWASFRVPVEADYFIYPKPKGRSTWPELHPSGEDGQRLSLHQGDDFAGVRPYGPGESLHHVDWKAYARGRPLSIKQFTGGDGRELWLDATEMSQMPLEDRLSQLALWIVNAEKEEMTYTLKLGHTFLPVGRGPAQSRRALEALAVAGMGMEEKRRKDRG